MSNRSKTQRPASRSSRASRPAGRSSLTMSGTESGAVPTEQPQASVLASWAANSPEQQPEATPWEAQAPARLDADPDGATEFDPDLAFGQRPADPLTAGARIDGGADYPFEAPTSPGASMGSSRADAGAPPNPLAAKGRAKALGKLGSAAFAAVSGVLNERLALDDQDETWLADDEELKAVEQPAGRLLSRKLPLGEGTDATDLADLIEIAVIAAGYAIYNTMAHLRARREARRRQQPAAVYQEA
ncbi:MAG: hypothetical protein ACRDVE_18105 [Actinocrinis sp.]